MLPSMHGTTSFLEMEADYSGRRLRRVALGQIGSHEQGNLSLFHQHRPPSFVPSSFSLASMPEQLYRPAPSPLAQSRCYACFSLSPSFQAFRSARIASPSLPPFLPSVLPPNDKISTMRAVRPWSRPRPSDGRSSVCLLEQHRTDSWQQRISPFDLDWPSITDVPSESSSTTAVRAAAAHVVVVVPAIAVCSASTLQAIIRNRPRWAGVAPPVAVLKMK